MNNIFKAFNVTSQREFDRLIETLELDGNDTATLFTVLNEDCDYNYLREKVLETAITFGNGSYEKLQKQFEKAPFKRVLKEKYIDLREPDPTGELEAKVSENNANQQQSQPNQIKEGLDAELDLGKILASMKDVISTTTSIELLNKLFNSLNEKTANAKSEEDIAKINEVKTEIKERIKEIGNIGHEEDDTIKECFDYSVPVSPVFNDVEVNSTLEDIFNNIKPATINIEINYEEKSEEDEDEMAKNNMRALASHFNNDVDCCEEHRLEELQTVNTLLSMLSNYFNKKLGV